MDKTLTAKSVELMLAEALKKKCRATGIEDHTGKWVYYGQLRRIGHSINVFQNEKDVHCVVDFLYHKDGRECINLLFNNLEEFVEAIPTLVWHLTLDKKGGKCCRLRFMGGYYLDRVKRIKEKRPG